MIHARIKKVLNVIHFCTKSVFNLENVKIYFLEFYHLKKKVQNQFTGGWF
jgi:hypothetical protein